MSAIQSTPPRFELRFGGQRSAQTSPAEQPAFATDSVDLGASQVTSSSKDFPPGCLTGGSTNVTSGGDLGPCMGGATDVASSSKDFPPGCLTGGATDVASSSKDFPPGCLTGGATDVASSSKDFPPGCLTGGATDVSSGSSWNIA